jgi:hypothetical protein
MQTMTALLHVGELPLQVDNHLLSELQVVLADKAALEEEKAAAQVRPQAQRQPALCTATAAAPSSSWLLT